MWMIIFNFNYFSFWNISLLSKAKIQLLIVKKQLLKQVQIEINQKKDSNHIEKEIPFGIKINKNHLRTL
jgi:hypothetical protein